MIEELLHGGKKKKKALYKGREYKMPRVTVDRDGRSFIRFKKKKIILADNISERDLIKFIIQQLAPSKRKIKKRERREKPVLPEPTSRVISIPDGAQDTKISNLKQEVEALKIQAVDRLRLKEAEERADMMLIPKAVFNDGAKRVQKSEEDEERRVAEANAKRLYSEMATPLSVHTIPVLQKVSKSLGIKLNSRAKKADYVDALLRHGWDGVVPSEIRSKSKIPTPKKPLGTPRSDPVRKPISIQFEDSDDEEEQKGDGLKVGPDGMSNLEIDKVMKPYRPEYLGAISSDEIPTLLPHVKPNTRVCWIMNSDPSGLPGDHWTACLVDCRPHGSKSIEFYNPLGILDRRRLTTGFLRDVIPLLEKINPEERPLKLKENLVADQNNTSSNCGPFSIRFLIQRLKGKSFSEASGYDEKGERMIEKWKDSFYPFRNIAQNGRGLGSWLKKGYEYVKGRVVKGIATVTDRVKDLLSNGLRKELPPSVRDLLSGPRGDEVIQEIVVARVPIKSWLKKIMDWASSGTFSRNLKDLDYDEAFHLFMKIRTDKGAYLTEKNEVVKLKPEGWTSGDAYSKEAQRINVAVKPGATVRDLFTKAASKYGDERIAKYDSRNNNCQGFIKDLLTASGMMTDAVSKFVLQDAAVIYKNMDIIGSINRGVTDIAAGVNQIIEGRGQKKRN